MKHILVFLAGAIFSGGLVLSEMTRPEKVRAFLDFTGNWDPSLLFVLGSAVVTYGVIFHFVSRARKPVYELKFDIPNNTKITAKLIIGAAIFGVGWGITGLCPGPAFTSIFASSEIFYFVLAVFVGMGIADLFKKLTPSEDVVTKF